MATLRRIFKQENSDEQKSSSSLRKLFKDKKKLTPHQKAKKGKLPEPPLPVERAIQREVKPVDPLPPKQPEEEDPLCDILPKLQPKEEVVVAAEEVNQWTTDLDRGDDKVSVKSNDEKDTRISEGEEEGLELEEEDQVTEPIVPAENIVVQPITPNPSKANAGRPKAGREKTRRSRPNPHHLTRKDDALVRCESEQTFGLSPQLKDSTLVDSHSLPETNKELNNVTSLPNANIESSVEIQKLVKEMMVLQRNVENLMNFNNAWVKKEQSHREILELRQDLGSVIQELRILRTNLTIHRQSVNSPCAYSSDTQLQRPMRLSVSRKCPTVADFTLAEQLRILQEEGPTVSVSGEVLLERGKSIFLPAEIVVKTTSLVGKCLLHCCFIFGRGLWLIWCFYLKLYPIM